MKIFAFASAALLMITGQALAQETPSHPISSYVKGMWKYPSVDMIMAAYPPRALQEHVSGRATLDCLIAVDGTLAACEIISETPEGYDFGRATAILFIKTVRVKPSSIEGGLRPDSRKKFTLAWKL